MFVKFIVGGANAVETIRTHNQFISNDESEIVGFYQHNNQDIPVILNSEIDTDSMYVYCSDNTIKLADNDTTTKGLSW